MKAQPASKHYADQLSFMRKRKPRGSGIDYWVVDYTGDYAVDCETGRKLAIEFIDLLGNQPTNGNATLLIGIVNDMIAAARNRGAKRLGLSEWLSGVEIGFLSEVGHILIGGAALMALPEARTFVASNRAARAPRAVAFS